MTNTTDTAPYISNFAKVSALVDVESVGLYTGPVSDAMYAGVAEGFLTSHVFGEVTTIRLTPAGRDRLTGFRALLATSDD